MRIIQIVDNCFILGHFKSQNEQKNRKLQSNSNLSVALPHHFAPFFSFFDTKKPLRSKWLNIIQYQNTILKRN